MIARILGTPLGPYNMPKLRTEAAAKWPKLENLNEVNEGVPQIAFYFEQIDLPRQSAVDALLAAHDPTPDPIPPVPLTTEQTAFYAAGAVLGTTFGIARTPEQIDRSLDAVTVVLRRIYPRELQ